MTSHPIPGTHASVGATPTSPSAGAAIDSELATWLASMNLDELAGPLKAFGARNMTLLKEALANDLLNAAVLTAHGATELAASLFMIKAGGLVGK